MWYPIFVWKQVFPMRYNFIASWNFCFNYLVSLTYILWKRGAVKSKNNTAKIKDLFLKVWYPVFDTHLAATLTISSEKDSKYAGVSFNWSLAIGSRKKSPQNPHPPDPKPNPIFNLTLTLPLTAYGGLFLRGDFFLTSWKSYSWASAL